MPPTESRSTRVAITACARGGDTRTARSARAGRGTRRASTRSISRVARRRGEARGSDVMVSHAAAGESSGVQPCLGVIGESWTRRADAFARDGFALSHGPVIPADIISRARASFARIVARADAGEYPAQASMEAPHVQGVVSDLATKNEGGAGGLRKVEMPQLDRRESSGIIELMNCPKLAE